MSICQNSTISRKEEGKENEERGVEDDGCSSSQLDGTGEVAIKGLPVGIVRPP